MRIDIDICEEGDAYIATSPDMPGFSAYGDTVSDCLREVSWELELRKSILFRKFDINRSVVDFIGVFNAAWIL